MSGSWIACSEQLPKASGMYPVFVGQVSGDKRRCVAWLEPDGTGNMAGWQLIPASWCKSITHWMEWPDDPDSKVAV